MGNVPSNIRCAQSHVPTEEAATMLMVQPQTMRKQFSQKGEYCGIRPRRLPNRRLAWPLAEIQALLNGGA
ncbi:hypothetical protein [Caballeronia sp. LZ065]|uniref:hypothetical protein n=1 Tax=Caballeronia sp. LZ065 TaxID=3038571 RepID=UPI00286B522C|nr:hypothetical protein [Caballeronia sp. LZ065]